MVAFGFILGEMVRRRVTSRTLASICAARSPKPMGIDVHIGLPADQLYSRCAEMINKPHIRDVLANGGAPGIRSRSASIRWPGCPSRWASCGRRTSSNELATWRCAEFPGTNGHVSALAWPPSTTGWPRRSCSAKAPREGPRLPGRLRPGRRAGPPRRRPRLGPGLHAQPAPGGRAERAQLRPRGSGGSYGFVDLEHGIGYAYVMNYFDATKCNADPAPPP